jgi:hypothetical protein
MHKGGGFRGRVMRRIKLNGLEVKKYFEKITNVTTNKHFS